MNWWRIHMNRNSNFASKQIFDGKLWFVEIKIVFWNKLTGYIIKRVNFLRKTVKTSLRPEGKSKGYFLGPSYFGSHPTHLIMESCSSCHSGLVKLQFVITRINGTIKRAWFCRLRAKLCAWEEIQYWVFVQTKGTTKI